MLGPASGPGFVIYATFVRAAGSGTARDPAHLLKALGVAIPDYDITIDVREVEELGPDGIDALSRVSRKIHEWRAGRLFILATPDEGVWGELESSVLADVGKHPRIYLVEATESRNRHSN